MFQIDELAEVAEQLRAQGIDACHYFLYGPHACLEGLEIGDTFFPLWELILPENEESFERRDFAAIEARRPADWSIERRRQAVGH